MAPSCAAPALTLGGSRRSSRPTASRGGRGRCAGPARTLGAVVAVSAAWRAALHTFTLGVSTGVARPGAGIEGLRESRTRLGSAAELKAEDIGKMYATGDADMDELADNTWKEHFRSAFQSMDHDEDGKISLDDFSKSVSGMGVPFTKLSEASVANIFKLADVDGDSFLAFDEFIAWQKSTRSLLESFLQLDLDQDGLIGKEEWGQALSKAGVDWSPEECDENFDGADIDGDGFLDFSEYTMWAAKA